MHQARLAPRVAVFAFSERLQTLYMNTRAAELSGATQPQSATKIPPDVLGLAEGLLPSSDPQTSRRVHLQQEIRHAGSPWIVQGFVIPTERLSQSKLIIVLMEPSGTTALHDASRFGLTPRQSDIADLVVQGLTNRQIAAQLYLAEQTVKDHMKHIMVKMEAPTRTALVASLLTRAGPERPESPPDARTGSKSHVH